MSIWKRAGALMLTALVCLVPLSGCSREPAGISLSVCVGGEPVTLDPIYAEETGDQTILVHLYENLMRVVSDGSGKTSVTNGIAKSVSQDTNYDGSVTYTFKLRSARWSDGRTVRASDFVYAWQRLADPASQSPFAELLSVVVGYDEARATGDMSLLQVTAKNETTLVVVLNGNYDWFLREVCTSPATMPLRKDVVQKLKEAADAANSEAADREGSGTERWWSDPTALVTNGPYQAVSYHMETGLETAVMERYYGPQSGPRTLTFRFADTAEAAWELYEKKEVDAVSPLTEDRLAELAADESWEGIPELGTYSVIYNCDVFQDIMVRQAMSLAIDRNALAEAAGVTARPAEGLVPFGVPESEDGDFRTVSGALLDNDPELYGENCIQARQLLAEAGYDSGSDLGQLEYLYLDSGMHSTVAQALCEMWKTVLGMDITPRGVTERELWSALRTGAYSIAGAKLHAAGNDAECFLTQWTTGSPDNVARYANSAYDTLMAIIASAPDGTARMGCLHDAEELLLTDYALVPLYNRNSDWQLREPLMGGCRDARGWFSFSGIVARTN